MNSFDQATDYSKKELYTLLRNAELPEYVKTAEVDDYDALAELQKEAFADSNRKIYPINDPSRVFISNAYFLSKQADIEKLYGKNYSSQIESRIKEAAAIFGISEDLERYAQTQEKKASEDYPEFHLGEFAVDGVGEVSLYPVKTAQDLEENTSHFVRNMANYPFDWRVKIAGEIVKTAHKVGTNELPDIVLKYAGYFYPDFENLETEIWRRSTKLQKEAHVEIYNNLKADVKNITTVEEVMKLAETLFNVENMEGLYDNVKVAGILGDPVDRIFTKSIEKVAEALSFIEAHGDKYRVADLQKVSADKYQEAFGFDIDPSDLEKLADVFPTMPRSDIKLFEEIAGVVPIR
jgi:hypothetical protein